MISVEMLWNRINAMADEVHENAIKTARIEEKLNNHLKHVDKKTNAKIAYLAIGMTALVGLTAIFI